MILTLLVLMNLVRPLPLVESPILDARAQVRAEQLCRDNQWSHDGWLKSFEGIPFRYAGENLDKRFTSPVDAFNALMKSPTHKANIENLGYTEVGIGHACDIDVVLFKG